MKFLINMIIILSLSTIVSCTTPRELRSRPPTAKYTSSLSAKEVGMCIANKWKSAPAPWPQNWLHPTPWIPDIRPTEYGYVLIVYIDGDTQFLVDIKDEEPGSSTSYWENVFGTVPLFDEAVKDCQNENQDK